jgi:hypothetical protein
MSRRPMNTEVGPLQREDMRSYLERGRIFGGLTDEQIDQGYALAVRGVHLYGYKNLSPMLRGLGCELALRERPLPLERLMPDLPALYVQLAARCSSREQVRAVTEAFDGLMEEFRRENN